MITGGLGSLFGPIIAPDRFTFRFAVAVFVGRLVGGTASMPNTAVGTFFRLFVPNIAEPVSPGFASAVYGVFLLLVTYLMLSGTAG